MVSVAHAQDPTPPNGPQGDTVPAWVFYWLLGLGTTIGGALVTALKVLWTRLTTQEAQTREHYEGDPGNPAKPGVMAQLRQSCEREKAELRSQVEQWRQKCEASESARREDSERYRQAELENLRQGMQALQDVGTALKENTAEIHALVVEIRGGESAGEET